MGLFSIVFSDTFGYVEVTPVDLTGDVSAVYGMIIRWLLYLGMQLVIKKWGCRSRKEKVICTEVQEHTSYMDIVAFVEREITLTFVNKVRSLILLSLESKIILLLM